MRCSKILFTTTRNIPKEATMKSHALLLRGGFIRMLAKGIYSFLPLGFEVVRKVSNVVRQEMNRAGAQELLMPFVHPAELWIETGRWESFGEELLKFKNREGAEFCIGPTHEEVITDIARREIKSYRQLPINLYQIQTKFRDEPRPRAGLLRCREFIMKDAYSFDVTPQDAKESYKKMLIAYARVMARLGLDFRVVRAPTGAIGGDLSHEFQVITPSGEDTLVLCNSCGYAVNVEIAEAAEVEKTSIKQKNIPPEPKIEEVKTPDKRTVTEVSEFLSVSPEKIIKTIIAVYEDKAIAVLVRGDRELNLSKLAKFLGIKEAFIASDAEVERVTKAPVGFAGPVGLNIPIYADIEIMEMEDVVCGANKAHTHLIHVFPGRDFKITAWGDLRKVGSGDPCPVCKSSLITEKGIEGGQTFYLGTLYSEKMNATFADKDGSLKPFEMGCYGIGITRLVAAVVEQKSDEKGIIWPTTISPYDFHIISIGEDKKIQETAFNITAWLEENGKTVLWDDRDLSPGIKFNDADLTGIPVQIIIGPKAMKEGKVEIKTRDGSENEVVSVIDAGNKAIQISKKLESKLDEYAHSWEKKILKVTKME